MRRRNASVLCVTRSLADAADSSTAAISESCLACIFGGDEVLTSLSGLHTVWHNGYVQVLMLCVVAVLAQATSGT